MPTAAHFGYENNDSPQFPCMSDLWGQYEAHSKPFDVRLIIDRHVLCENWGASHNQREGNWKVSSLYNLDS